MRYTKHEILHDLQAAQNHLVKAYKTSIDLMRGASSGLAIDCRDEIQRAMFKVNEVGDKMAPAIVKLGKSIKIRKE